MSIQNQTIRKSGGPSQHRLLSQLFRAPWKFLTAWWHSRVPSNFWSGLPALASAIAIGVLVASGARTTAFDSAQAYRAVADAALAIKDFPAAELSYRRLRQINPNGAAAAYGAALVVEQQGNRDRARRLMHRIAPSDGPGFAPAHFWLALDLAARKPLSREQLEPLQHHLRQTIERQPRNLTAHLLLCDVLLSLGRSTAAVEFLARTAALHPALRLRLAKLRLQLNKKDPAQRQAESARDQFRKLAEKSPDEIGPQIQWSQSELLLGNFSRATEIVQQAAKRSKDPRYQTALAELHLAWSEMLDKAGQGNLNGRLELLQRGLELSPRHPGLLKQLAALANETNDAGVAARTALKEALAGGEVPAVAHLMLGTAAAMHGDQQEAALHLEQAHRLDPRMPAVLNNLAWVLASGEDPQLERAAQLADAAIESAPNHPEFRETRGQILARQGRWKDATADLEFALQRLPRTEAAATLSRLHTTLAELYEKIGDKELAAAHRRLIERALP
jgi:tetratricopeptide (TPR) repeat protein